MMMIKVFKRQVKMWVTGDNDSTQATKVTWDMILYVTQKQKIYKKKCVWLKEYRPFLAYFLYSVKNDFRYNVSLQLAVFDVTKYLNCIIISLFHYCPRYGLIWHVIKSRIFMYVPRRITSSVSLTILPMMHTKVMLGLFAFSFIVNACIGLLSYLYA